MTSGSLTLVGIGLKLVSHVTVEAQAHIEQADQVYLVLADAAANAWVQSLNPTAEHLPFYTEHIRQQDTYRDWLNQVDAWTTHLFDRVRSGQAVCVVFTGHPGVGVTPIRRLLHRARAEGITAAMLPGISAEDSLFADLGVDPAEHGCQSFEATDFLLRRRPFATTAALVLWQIGIIGEFAQTASRINPNGLRVLADVLADAYGTGHVAVVYEAASTPLTAPVVQHVALS
jgi:uncharacterized protein YabN with tetrapyrrole methylase and pyrophosphatase domain